MKSKHIFRLAFGAFAGVGATAVAHAQSTAPAVVSENGYTLFFLGFALLGLALFNFRRRT